MWVRWYSGTCSDSCYRLQHRFQSLMNTSVLRRAHVTGSGPTRFPQGKRPQATGSGRATGAALHRAPSPGDVVPPGITERGPKEPDWQWPVSGALCPGSASDPLRRDHKLPQKPFEVHHENAHVLGGCCWNSLCTKALLKRENRKQLSSL